MEWLKTHRNDAILVIVLLFLGGALVLFQRVTRQTGGYVSVQIDGETVRELPLHEDVYLWTFETEGGTNTLSIVNGTARIDAADCPDQICVRQGGIRYAGESIVCLPHKLVVTVEGGEQSGVDGTVG